MKKSEHRLKQIINIYSQKQPLAKPKKTPNRVQSIMSSPGSSTMASKRISGAKHDMPKILATATHDVVLSDKDLSTTFGLGSFEVKVKKSRPASPDEPCRQETKPLLEEEEEAKQPAHPKT